MGIIETYFETHSVIMLFCGMISLLFCICFLALDKEKQSLLFLLFASLSLFTFAITLDPFLNLWDERFHALVAKNLMEHPFVPTLYDNPIVVTAYDRWDRYYLWFHKQPLFLWQIMLCFKLFGISEYTLRIPNVLMALMMTYAIFKSGKILINYKVGIIAGIIFCTSHYLLDLASGRTGLDHNDFSFICYITLSIWVFFEYYTTKNRKWLVAIGLFAGLAILCKWLVGLLVYFGWGIVKLISKQFSIRHYGDLVLALCVTIAIAAPWQIYEFLKFPNEAIKEFAFYADHFNMALEGHSGTWFYHFNLIPKIYSKPGALLMIPAFLIFYLSLREKRIFWFFLANISIVYFFFTLAQTKMPSFTVILFMLFAIPLASGYEFLFKQLSWSNKYLKNSAFFLTILIGIYYNIKIDRIEINHTIKDNPYPNRAMLIQNKAIFQKLDLPENAVVFNVKGRHYIECMFYTGLPCYNFIPTELQYDDLKNKDSQIAIFDTSKNGLPEYLAQDDQVIIVKKEIRGYD